MTKFVMILNVMKNIVKTQRKAMGLRIHEVAAHLGVDASLISRFESGSRLPTESQVVALAQILNIPLPDLMAEWNAERIWKQIKDYPYIETSLSLVQEKHMAYGRSKSGANPAELEAILTEIDALKAELDQLRKFDSYRIAEALELEYTFESNRIEGNTLTLQETNLVVNDGLTISGKSMREHLEAINHTEAIGFMKSMVNQKHPIAERDLLQMHNLILRGIDSQYAGVYRNIQVRIQGSERVFPEPYLVAKEMETFFHWSTTMAPTLHPVVRAAEAHQRLVNIHPFIDGNGRTCRLLMNLILLQNGYVIANIKGDTANRLAYYDALEAFHKSENSAPFHLFVAKNELECMQAYIKILGGKPSKS